jgi:hypothetical protein
MAARPKKSIQIHLLKPVAACRESKQCYNIGSTAGWPVSDNITPLVNLLDVPMWAVLFYCCKAGGPASRIIV